MKMWKQFTQASLSGIAFRVFTETIDYFFDYPSNVKRGCLRNFFFYTESEP